MIGQDQIRKGAGLIQKASEADNVRNFRESFRNSPRRWAAENRIRIVEEQQLNRRRGCRQDFSREITEGTALTVPCIDIRAGTKRDPPGLTYGTHECIEGIHGQRLKHSVRVCQGRATDYRQSGTVLRKLMR